MESKGWRKILLEFDQSWVALSPSICITETLFAFGYRDASEPVREADPFSNSDIRGGRTGCGAREGVGRFPYSGDGLKGILMEGPMACTVRSLEIPAFRDPPFASSRLGEIRHAGLAFRLNVAEPDEHKYVACFRRIV